MIEQLDEILKDTESTQGFDPEVKKLIEQLESLENIQLRQTTEVEALLGDIDDDVLKYLKDEIEKDINLEIDKIVDNQVTQELNTHIPRSLREKMKKQKDEVQAIQAELHNSESCRANSSIKDLSDPIQAIYNEKGESSPLFPGSMRDLLALPDGNVRDLTKFYGGTLHSRNDQINWLMRLWGLDFHMLIRSGLVGMVVV